MPGADDQVDLVLANFFQQHPERLKQMRSVLETMYREVQQESPTWPAWEFARYESQRIEWPPYRGSKRVEKRTPVIPPKYLDNPAIETIE